MTKGLTYKYDEIKYHYLAHGTFMQHFYGFHQNNISDSDYLNKFNIHLDVIEQYGGMVGYSDGGTRSECKDSVYI